MVSGTRRASALMPLHALSLALADLHGVRALGVHVKNSNRYSPRPFLCLDGHVTTTVYKTPLSRSGYSGYPSRTVPGIRKCRITPHWGGVLTVAVMTLEGVGRDGG